MALAIFDAITIHISRFLELLFDELEYRLAKRALHRAAKLKARRLRHKTVIPTDKITTSKAAPIRAT